MAIETEGARSFPDSVAAGELVTLPQITSIATTLGAKTVTPKLMEWVPKHDIRPLVVSDKTAVDACLRFADDLRVVVEPACGASLSVLYEHTDALDNFDSVLMVVCGGAGVSMEQLRTWEQQL